MYRIYDSGYRGDCPKESSEQKHLVKEIRSRFPKTIGKVLFHVENEGKRGYGQANYARQQGQTKGASDLIIPGNPSCVIELKRRNKSLSKVSKEQHDFLVATHELGAFACLCYGAAEALKAVDDYINEYYDLPK